MQMMLPNMQRMQPKRDPLSFEFTDRTSVADAHIEQQVGEGYQHTDYYEGDVSFFHLFLNYPFSCNSNISRNDGKIQTRGK
jgi:hypothetical protein